jgi:succinyl-CoA synthetase beta subunit
MKIHEYQAKEILKDYGVPVPRGRVAETPDEARKIAEEIGAKTIVVKAQIYAGGRRTAKEKMEALARGGVYVVRNPALIGEEMAAILKRI